MNTADNQKSPLPLLIPSFLPKPGLKLEKHLPNRFWSNTVHQNAFRQAHHDYFKFQLVCYNILAQQLLEENDFLYENCTHNHLKWYKRRERLIRELLRHDADIICLQEMQVNHYEREFRPQLNECGYDSIYLKRSGDKRDGCCIFFKRSRVRLVAHKLVPFYKRSIRLLDRDNCGLIALFQPANPFSTQDDLFCVATTHLLFSPKRGDIKLAQLQYFLAEIDQFAQRDSQANTHYPIILSGDFNAHPQSPLIQFLLSGHIQYDRFRCVDISGQLPDAEFSYPLPPGELLPASLVSSDCRLSSKPHGKYPPSLPMLTHDKQFQSVYDLNQPTGVTTNARDVPQFVDYIFYTQSGSAPERLNVLSYLNLYQESQMTDVHIPNHQFPSDHFLLSVKFALKYQK